MNNERGMLRRPTTSEIGLALPTEFSRGAGPSVLQGALQRWKQYVELSEELNCFVRLRVSGVWGYSVGTYIKTVAESRCNLGKIASIRNA